MRCSASNSPSPAAQQIAGLDKIMQESMEKNQQFRENAAKNIFYSSYENLDSLGNAYREGYGIKKITEDSLVRLDLLNEVKIPKKSFFLNNYDDTLRFAVKFPDNTILYAHDLQSNDDTEVILKSIKGNALSNVKKDEMTKGLGVFEYKIEKNSKIYNGFSFVTQEKGNVNFMEFESAEKSAEVLKRDAVDFLTKNLIKK